MNAHRGRRSLPGPIRHLCGLLLLSIAVCLAEQVVAADPASRCTAIELYLVGDAAQQQADAQFVAERLAERQGLTVREYNVTDDAKAQKRHAAIVAHFKLDAAEAGKHAIFYACNRFVLLSERTDAVAERIKELLRFEFFGRRGCPHCAQAEPWVTRLLPRYPGFELIVHDAVTEPDAGRRVASLAQQYRTAAASYPVLHVCGQLLVGWDSDRTSGKRVETLLDRWTLPCPEKPPAAAPEAAEPMPPQSEYRHARSVFALVSSRKPVMRLAAVLVAPDSEVDVPSESSEPAGELPIGELPIDELPLPGEDAGDADAGTPLQGAADADVIDLPIFGTVRASELGMPAFTLAVGLIDGFNPCAMWVLLFLLSVLVSVHSRVRMIAVAGTFVIISGVAYFAFIAAWLNVLQWVGLLRPVQIALATLALFVGAVHIKDFFAFQRGLTLSIPASAKPGIYARVRSIVSAERLWTAITGAIVLAVLVNFIELLCTAGLPCLYSQVLALQGYPAWKDYLYLLLYIAAYMFDDSLMVIGVVATLGRPKMQEVHGRWLKLVSGGVIFALGLVMMFRPQWLV